MARYPTFEEYQKRGNYAEGVARCKDLLQRNPNDVQLLTVQLRLLVANKEDIASTLDRLLALTPPIQDTRTLLTIEEAVVESQHDIYPRPRTAGPVMATLFSNAHKSARSVEQKLDLQSLRFTTAIYDNRLEDAQQALIQMKALQPKNRVLYMAHAAVTQLLSNSSGDLQARLAGSLAKKAVVEKFDDDEGLDCRVVGQILALQGAVEEVRGLAAKFTDSKQAFEVLHPKESLSSADTNGLGSQDAKDDAKSTPAERLAIEARKLEQQFASLIQTQANINAMNAFATDAIRAFHSAIGSLGSGKEGRTTADICFVSISSLVRSFELSNSPGYLLNAAYLAGSLLKHDPHIHEARLILVYLYMRLGLGSSAIQLFDSLNIKEIQHDTVGHALLTDISYTHPHSLAVSRRDKFDPLKRASNALAVYTRCEDKLAETESSVLNHGQTGMIFEVQELRDKLHSSLTKRLILLEQRRLARLTQGKAGEDTGKLGARVLPTWLEYSDNRDFHATFDCGYNVEQVLSGNHHDQRTPPSRAWLLSSLVLDSAWCLALGFPTPVNDVQELISEFNKIGINTKHIQQDSQVISSTEISTSSHLVADLACQVSHLLLDLHQADAKTVDRLAAASNALLKLDVTSLTHHQSHDSPAVNTHIIKTVSAYLDILRTTVAASQAARDFLKTPSPDVVAGLTTLQSTARSAFAALQVFAAERVKWAQSPSAAGDIRAVMQVDAGVTEAVETVGTTQQLMEFCASVAESTREGWEGIERIQLV